jgi:Brp/Blh family beta-carotene 15,15'-monooxygenase
MITRPAFETLFYLSVSLLAGAFLLLDLPMPSANVQVMLLAVGVALIGLPHGALDPLLAKRAGLMEGWRGVGLFHGAYVGAAGLVLGMWMIAPVLSLSVFLLYSAYHFAGDWMRGPWLARVLLGACVLSLPAVAHVSDVGTIYGLLASQNAVAIAEGQHWLGPLWICGIGVACAVWLMKGQFWQVAEIVTLAVSAMLLPPLVFFLIYFCGLHSPRHFLQVWRASADKLQAGKVAGVYTALTLVVAIPAALSFPGSIEASLQQIVFIGLAALTVPHMILSSLLEARADG